MFLCKIDTILTVITCSVHKFSHGNANNICQCINISNPWHLWCQGFFYFGHSFIKSNEVINCPINARKKLKKIIQGHFSNAPWIYPLCHVQFFLLICEYTSAVISYCHVLNALECISCLRQPVYWFEWIGK